MRNKKIVDIILITLLILILITSFIPTVYWFLTPNMTEMEIFIKFWKLYLGIGITSLLFKILADKFGG